MTTTERLDAVVERVHAMRCDRTHWAPDVMEWFDDGPCAHCDLLTILEGQPKP